MQLRIKPNKNDISVKMLQWVHDKLGWDMPTSICGYFWNSVLIPYLSICLLIGVGLLLGMFLPFMIPAVILMVAIIISTQGMNGCNRPWFDKLLTKLTRLYNKICPKIDID